MGDGEWEWTTDDDGEERFLDEHPHAINPTTHRLVSWNNRPAPDWSAADANWGFSARYRSNLLEDSMSGTEDSSKGELVGRTMQYCRV